MDQYLGKISHVHVIRARYIGPNVINLRIVPQTSKFSTFSINNFDTDNK